MTDERKMLERFLRIYLDGMDLKEVGEYAVEVCRYLHGNPIRVHYNRIVASPAKSGRGDQIHLHCVTSGEAADFSHWEFEKALNKAALDFFNSHF